MAGLFILFFLFLLVAGIFLHYRYERKNKSRKIPRKDLLIGYDFSKGSPWMSSSMTKEASESPTEVTGESPDQDLLDKIFRPRTDEGMEKMKKVARKRQ